MARSRRPAKYLDIHPEDPQPRLIEQAVSVLKDGGLIAYPTDSCYALGCTLGNVEALTNVLEPSRVLGGVTSQGATLTGTTGSSDAATT